MPDRIAGFPEVDRTIHEPARLAILTVLSSCDHADFTFLQAVTGLTKGNLSVQLTRLEEAGLIHTEKIPHGKKSRTVVKLSRAGRHQLGSYWDTMRRIQTRGIPEGT